MTRRIQRPRLVPPYSPPRASLEPRFEYLSPRFARPRIAGAWRVRIGFAASKPHVGDPHLGDSHVGHSRIGDTGRVAERRRRVQCRRALGRDRRSGVRRRERELAELAESTRRPEFLLSDVAGQPVPLHNQPRRGRCRRRRAGRWHSRLSPRIAELRHLCRAGSRQYLRHGVTVCDHARRRRRLSSWRQGHDDVPGAPLPSSARQCSAPQHSVPAAWQQAQTRAAASERGGRVALAASVPAPRRSRIEQRFRGDLPGVGKTGRLARDGSGMPCREGDPPITSAGRE